MAAQQRRNWLISYISSSEYVFVPHLPGRGALIAAELDKFMEMGLKTTRQSTRQQLTCLDERFRRRRRSYSWISGYRTPFFSITDVRINRNQLTVHCTVVWDHFTTPYTMQPWDRSSWSSSLHKKMDSTRSTDNRNQSLSPFVKNKSGYI
jgi:hypothetical protein